MRFGGSTSPPLPQNHDPNSGKAYLWRGSRFFGAAVALVAVAAATEPRADELSPDHAAIYTLQDENASISSSVPTDRYYVNGVASVPRNWLDGELELGAAFIFNNWCVSYTQVFETPTFRGEQGGLHQFGSLALSARF